MSADAPAAQHGWGVRARLGCGAPARAGAAGPHRWGCQGDAVRRSLAVRDAEARTSGVRPYFARFGTEFAKRTACAVRSRTSLKSPRPSACPGTIQDPPTLRTERNPR